MSLETGERRRISSSYDLPWGFTSDGRHLVTSAVSGAPTVLHVWAIPEGRLEHTLEKPRGQISLYDDPTLIFAVDRIAVQGERRVFVVRRLSLDGRTQQVLGRWEPEGLPDWAGDPSGTWVLPLQRGRVVQQRFDALAAPGRVLGTHEGDALL